MWVFFYSNWSNQKGYWGTYSRKRKFPFSIKLFFIEVTFSKILLEVKKELEGPEIPGSSFQVTVEEEFQKPHTNLEFLSKGYVCSFRFEKTVQNLEILKGENLFFSAQIKAIDVSQRYKGVKEYSETEEIQSIYSLREMKK